MPGLTKRHARLDRASHTLGTSCTLRYASVVSYSAKAVSSAPRVVPAAELRSLRSLRPLPLSPASQLRRNLYPTGPSPCPCPGVDTPAAGTTLARYADGKRKLRQLGVDNQLLNYFTFPEIEGSKTFNTLIHNSKLPQWSGRERYISACVRLTIRQQVTGQSRSA